VYQEEKGTEVCPLPSDLAASSAALCPDPPDLRLRQKALTTEAPDLVQSLGLIPSHLSAPRRVESVTFSSAFPATATAWKGVRLVGGKLVLFPGCLLTRHGKCRDFLPR
jgi:hypothetical protein